jgi:hypothetical protein
MSHARQDTLQDLSAFEAALLDHRADGPVAAMGCVGGADRPGRRHAAVAAPAHRLGALSDMPARYVHLVGWQYGKRATVSPRKVYGPQNTVQPACGFANLARCATATASPQWSASYAPDQAIDGNGSTRWNSASGDRVGAWLALDFVPPPPLTSLSSAKRLPVSPGTFHLYTRR